MGVKGLWSLLNPVARPVQIESMEGKRLAIDSSIWLYQFQATMRDKDGRVLVNAHVLGFLRRINKLLFHGIKPVFVFDGGAPVLKRNTIAERKRRKAGAAANHARMAERLFAAQMRREAVKAAQSSRDEQLEREEAASRTAAATRYGDEEGDQIVEGATYLDELEGNPGPSRARPEPASRPSLSAQNSATAAAPGPELDPREERRKKFKKHDPYRLPEATMPTVSTADKPDARLATEEELKQFIDGVNPADIDVESPEFRALPTEVQYEIIGDLRVRSRQQSHRRLADMLRQAPSALDFSMAQIKHLSQRNALTQQLLTVTDMVGTAHLTIPVRIAAERNREYVLVRRNENEGGGWALGIREGSKQKPIEVPDKDEGDSEDEDDSDLESGYTDEIEEIKPPETVKADAELKEFRRREILEAIAARYAPKKAVKKPLDIEVKQFGKKRAPDATPLFDDAEEDEPEEVDDQVIPTANDEALALALQQEELGSDEEEPDRDLARALAVSRKEAEAGSGSGPVTKAVAAQSEKSLDDAEMKSEASDDSFEEVELVPSAVPTPQEVSRPPTPVEAGPIDVDSDSDDDFIDIEPALQRSTLQKPRISSKPSITSTKTLGLRAQPPPQTSTAAILNKVDQQLRQERSKPPAVVSAKTPSTKRPPPPIPTTVKSTAQSTLTPNVETVISDDGDDADDFVEIEPTEVEVVTTTKPSSGHQPQTFEHPMVDRSDFVPGLRTQSTSSAAVDHTSHSAPAAVPAAVDLAADPPTADTAPVSTRASVPSHTAAPPTSEPVSARPKSAQMRHPNAPSASPAPVAGPSRLSRTPSLQRPKTPAPPAKEDEDPLALALLGVRALRPVDRHSAAEMSEESYHGSVHGDLEDHDGEDDEEGPSLEIGSDMEEEDMIDWSRSPSPASKSTLSTRTRAAPNTKGKPSRPTLKPAQSGETVPSEVEEDADDGEMAPADMAVEEDDYARFIASIKNRDLNEVRTEIDDEIRVLHAQNKLAMRDADEITQTMVSQIQTLLRHFGIPYITAPMEAEAQCAKLAELNLVDGIITDDSDVFLFGGKQCFKNIFNDAKYAECFVLTDVDRELSLTRERLISLAFLLGSDYTIGLPGVGPVVALELLSNFPGPKGLDEFKSWWTKVQRGQDSPEETDTKWKKSFKKRFAPTILLTADWPNPLVREAYLYPDTDESDEPFHWGFPKLSALRTFLHEELSWSISKVDDELTPIVQRIARRGKIGSLNKQATLDPFFDISAGHGNYTPRRRTTANVSKRLMAVIKAYREAEARVAGVEEPAWSEMMKGLDEEDPKGRGTGKRRKVARTESLKEMRDDEDDGVKTHDDDDDDQKDKDKDKAKVKRRRVSRKKGDQTDIEGDDADNASSAGVDAESYRADSELPEPQKAKKARKSRAPRSQQIEPPVLSKDVEPTAGSTSQILEEAMAQDLPPQEILLPKNGLRGSSTGIVGSGKRKKAALKAWRDSTRAKDLAP